MIGHVRIIPEIVTCGYPVEQDERYDASKEGRNAAETISDVAHQATLWPDVLYFTQLERLLSRVFHAATAIGVLLPCFDTEECDAGDAETKRVEKQYH